MRSFRVNYDCCRRHNACHNANDKVPLHYLIDFLSHSFIPSPMRAKVKVFSSFHRTTELLIEYAIATDWVRESSSRRLSPAREYNLHLMVSDIQCACCGTLFCYLNIVLAKKVTCNCLENKSSGLFVVNRRMCAQKN
jgi:hypothetical protein